MALPLEHPRYLVIPKVGMNLAPYTLYAAMKRRLQRLLAAGERFDLIDAHYFYPDGVAAAWLGKAFNLPVTITARGTDINLIPEYATPRRLNPASRGGRQRLDHCLPGAQGPDG